MNLRYGLILLLCGLLGWGCINHFAANYIDETGGLDVTTSAFFEIPEPGYEPKIKYGVWSQARDDEIKMLEEGFVRIGSSFFNHKMGYEYEATNLAKHFHASVIILYSEFTHEVYDPEIHSYQVPIFIGKDIIVERTETYEVPRYYKSFDQLATFWIKAKDNVFPLGIFFSVPNDGSEKISSGKRRLKIIAVRNNSPAFIAGFQKGDILRRIGDIEINGPESYQRAVEKYAGSKAPVLVRRSGMKITKEVLLNPRPPISEKNHSQSS